MLSTDAASATLEDVLARYWGYTQFRPHQRAVMDAILDGRDSLLVMPTGGGKSLCFQAPALLKPGLAVVVSPLISLMKDQVDSLTANGVAAACYNSALDEDGKRDVVRGVRDGQTRLLYVAPERLVGDGGERFVRWLAQVGVSFIAVDEAHCISQWGHDFRPEYRRLGQLRALLPGASIHGFTATATSRVRRDIVAQLGLRDALEEVGSFDRPNLVYRVLLRDQLKKQLLDVLGRHRGEAGIVYCPSRKDVDALAAWLASEGWTAVPYHAGLPADERSRHQEAFLAERADIVVATVAFGMGIHRSNVRFVVHTGAPQSLEHYQQESGRAGRDGLEAECVLITSGADFLKWRVMLEKNGELTDSAQSLLRDIERYTASTRCRHRHLVQYFGEAYDRDDCGACDVCLGELEIVADAATVARKVLSCVARVGQRFGATHVTNVLIGKDSEAVAARGHAQLSTFGLFSGVPASEVRGYIEQLTAHGFLAQTTGDYPVLVLTPDGRVLMRDGTSDAPVALFRQKRRAKDSGPRRSRVETESWEGVDRELFEELREVRLRLARGRGVPPYVIFHDTTLREMARLKPASSAALRDIYGVGQRKAEDVGPAFLDVINRSNPL